MAKPDLTGASEQEAEVLEGEILESPEAGAMVIRGGLLRAAGYGAGILITAAASVLLLRYLGVVELGRYATVVSLIGIVSGVTDAGITTVGARDLARLPTAEQRRHLLSNLVGLRLVLTPIGVLAAVLFTALAGFDEVLVLGTLVAGFGLVLLNVQVTMTLLLSVDLKVGRLAVVDVIRQAVALAGIAVLVAAGASLLPFFSVYILAGIVLLALTPLLVGPNMAWRPAFDRETQRHLIREALPLAAAIVMNVLYFRILVILMSLIASGFATGLFATSFRIFEILFLIPSLVLAVALPVVSVAAETRPRLRYILQRMLEAGMVAAVYLVLISVILAEPALDLLAGREYRDAVPVLQIQVFALIPVFISQVAQLGLISLRQQRAIAIANAIALAAVVALGLSLIPVSGAEGAAIAAVIAEWILAAGLLTALVRFDRRLTPNPAFLWKVALAGLVGASVALVPGLPVAAVAALASVAYAATAFATRAVPPEVVDALRPSRSREAGIS